MGQITLTEYSRYSQALNTLQVACIRGIHNLRIDEKGQLVASQHGLIFSKLLYLVRLIRTIWSKSLKAENQKETYRKLERLSNQIELLNGLHQKLPQKLGENPCPFMRRAVKRYNEFHKVIAAWRRTCHCQVNKPKNLFARISRAADRQLGYCILHNKHPLLAKLDLRGVEKNGNPIPIAFSFTTQEQAFSTHCKKAKSSILGSIKSGSIPSHEDLLSLKIAGGIFSSAQEAREAPADVKAKIQAKKNFDKPPVDIHCLEDYLEVFRLLTIRCADGKLRFRDEQDKIYRGGGLYTKNLKPLLHIAYRTSKNLGVVFRLAKEIRHLYIADNDVHMLQDHMDTVISVLQEFTKEKRSMIDDQLLLSWLDSLLGMCPLQKGQDSVKNKFLIRLLVPLASNRPSRDPACRKLAKSRLLNKFKPNELSIDQAFG